MRTMKILGTMAAVWVGWVGVSLAGQLNAPDAPTGPGSAMHTLTDIYNRLNTGATNSSTVFTEPSSPPTNGTMYTLDEIYGLAGMNKVMKSGQTNTWAATGSATNYAVGDDGWLQNGVAWPNPRFTVVGAVGTAETNQIRDNLTGLIWARNANLATNTIWSATGLVAWPNTFDVITNSAGPVNGAPNGGYGGTNDWRLPNVRELFSLYDYGHASPALPANHPFVNVGANYWTSTSSDSLNAWRAALSGGEIRAFSKTTAYYVWPVRGGR